MQWFEIIFFKTPPMTILEEFETKFFISLPSRENYLFFFLKIVLGLKKISLTEYL